MDPGPVDRFVLHLQRQHHSSAVWGGDVTTWLTCRRRENSLRHLPLDDRRKGLIDEAGFTGLLQLSFISLDWHLITALVERWRPETHTFYMRNGEMTITLEDVAYMLGLPIDGLPVIGPTTSPSWLGLCDELLGVVPGPGDLGGSKIKMQWLVQHFSVLQANAADDTVLRSAWAYILQMFGGIIFPDKSGNEVSLMYLPFLEDLEVCRGYS